MDRRAYRDLVSRLEIAHRRDARLPDQRDALLLSAIVDGVARRHRPRARQPDPRQPGRDGRGRRRSCPSASAGPAPETVPTFLQVDFGLVRDDDGAIEPKLVELQAFASLYGFQLAVAEAYRDAFRAAAVARLSISTASTRDAYHSLVGEAIVGGHDPAEVVLMEIEPRKQKTWPDFVVTEQMWGVRAIDTSEVAARRPPAVLPARRHGARRSSASTTA